MDEHSHLIFGVPLHPMLVHFPIAFYFLELLLLALWFKKKDPQYLRFSRIAFSLGYLFMVAAAVAGFRDAGGWGKITGMVRSHFYGAVSVVVFYTLRAVQLKLSKEEDTRQVIVQFLGALVGNFLVMLTGFYGGRLVYQ